MFSMFRKGAQLSSPQAPADAGLAQRESVPEDPANALLGASNLGPTDSVRGVPVQESRADEGAPPYTARQTASQQQCQANESLPLEPRGDVTATSASASDCAQRQVDSWPAHVADSTSNRSPEHEVITAVGETTADSPSQSPLAAHAGRRQRRRRKGAPLAGPAQSGGAAGGGAHASFTPEQRLLLLDTWQRSGLPAKDFAALVGMSKHTLYKWKQLFDEQGPAGLMDQRRGPRRGSRLPALTQRTILMLKRQHPQWGCQRISDMLMRGPALAASASAVARVLHEAGYEGVQEASRPHRPKTCRFERARPNQLWQTDLFTFMLKRHNRRLYMVGFLDDHSRFLVSYGVHASASTALVLEALEAGICAWGPPEEILTDNGPQYVTWRGKSRFTRHLEKRGIRQIVARPRHPQTLGKIERFWGTLWREFLETAVFEDVADARARIGHFADYYNLLRPHRALEGLVPADRFFGAAPEVLQTLKQRVAANALELARHEQPKAPFYVTGQVDGQSFSVHAEGQRLILTKQGEARQEIELAGADKPGIAPLTANDTPSIEVPRQEESAPVTDEASVLPLCPSGAPSERADDPVSSAPPAPGQAVLDPQRLQEQLDEAGQEPSAGPREDAAEEDAAEEGGLS